ncbi:alkaline phosphatase D family protein [Ramlibacter algicola]|uniref:Alkaline phosphatase family protein n=1 Tax=Ramlibacter algicola TaxID=2795217 RepID=A0A934Q1P1_9BURK|nr:alkaline phosphatase D family protein [Ramlibacter algicola]MBK0393138.1 alkaline phosphatase family protein [Ramlibacter algicola]
MSGIQRRELLVGTAAVALAGCATTTPAQQPLRRVAFGSCFDQSQAKQPVWDAILAAKPDLFLFGGDNVYCEMPFTRERLREAYAQASTSAGLRRVRETIPHLAIWDDHDYGQNDGGADFAGKQVAKEEFLAYWNVPANDARRQREGLYTSQAFGPPGQRVQVIVLDTRWFRSPWKRTDQRDAPGKERYVADADPSKTILGAAQWAWLEQQLREPAQVRLILSGYQVLAEGHGWERWGLLPHEKQKLLRLLADTRAGGVVLLSGDRHIGTFYRDPGTAYPLTEVTASGFTHTWEAAREAGPNRIGELFTELHFGTVDIDWAARAIQLALVDLQGRTRRSVALSFDELKVTA